MSKRLENKVAIVTGSTSGIGLETAKLFLKEGARVVISGRREEIGTNLEKSLGSNCKFIRCDVLVEAEISHLINEGQRIFGRVDIIFNNAGAPDFVRNIEDITYEKVTQSLNLLLTSVIIGTREAAKVMKEQGSGSIINTASIAGHWGGCGGSVYSAAKAGVIHFSKVAALELARQSVRINSISPGAIVTEIFGVGRKLQGKDLETSDKYLRETDAFNDFQPIPRAGLPEDIANLALFLASDESSFVTGQDFLMDGGLTAGRPLDLASKSFKKINDALREVKG